MEGSGHTPGPHRGNQKGQETVKEETIAFRDRGDEYELVYSDVRADGSTSFSKCAWPKQGGVRSWQEGGFTRKIIIVETKITDAEGFTTVQQNGKQIAVNHWAIDGDGQTMRFIGKNVDASGKAYDSLLLWERQ